MKTHRLGQAVQEVLQQGMALLNDCDHATYTRVVGAPFEASIGQHYRHVLDHFLCLTSAVVTNRIDYDQRARDKRVEADVDHARALTRMLMQFFQELSLEECERVCGVTYSVGYHDQDAQELSTTYGREVAYSISHAVHHFAIIKLLCAQANVSVPQQFGVAPSTLKYRASQRIN